MASCARRLGRKPYEHGAKSASKIGSSTSFKDAWTTRSATEGTAAAYCPFCCDGLGFCGEVPGFGDAPQAGGLDRVVPGDAPASGGGLAGGQVTVGDPV